jgi:hypothetical protein
LEELVIVLLSLRTVLAALLFSILFIPLTASGQTTAFTYQGRLTDNGSPASGQYDLQFKLFDTQTVGTGAQQGTTINLAAVQVTAGLFTVQLDFGAAVFPGADRFLEVGVKPAGSPNPYAVLAPRQPLTSTPYTIRSLGAKSADGLSVACVNCVTSSQIGSVSGSVVTGTIPVASVPPGSGSYIQNSALPQSSSTFNISGNGTVGGLLSAAVVNTSSQYNIAANRALYASAINNNIFAGIGAGGSNTTGSENAYFGNNAGQNGTTAFGNAFFGYNAGKSNTTASGNAFFGYFTGANNTSGLANAFFGASAGANNTTASLNSFFGNNAGLTNTIGGSDSFFGSSAGSHNTSGENNSFFGALAGLNNTTGNNNAYFGVEAGANGSTASQNACFGAYAGTSNTTGEDNAFFGYEAGLSNTEGDVNSFFGFLAGVANTTGNSNAFFGGQAGYSNVTGSSNSFFGGQAGYANTSGGSNAFFGSGAGVDNTTGGYNAFLGTGSGFDNSTGQSNTFIGFAAGLNNITGSNNTAVGASVTFNPSNLDHATAIGADSMVSSSNTIALGRSDGSDKVVVYGLGTAGSTQLCRNASNQIATCSSSLRYKTNIVPFSGGLAIISRLRPITFSWKQGGVRDVGLGAEEVEKVEPLLTFRNAKGEVEGVKYNQLSAVFINAFKEQQAQIANQQQEIRDLHSQVVKQEAQIEALKKLVCKSASDAELCK